MFILHDIACIAWETLESKPSCDLSFYVNKFGHIPHVDVPLLNCVTGAILHSILQRMEDFDGHVVGKCCHPPA